VTKPESETMLPSPLPRHVAIIMDGNGRWARQRRLPRAAGHVSGIAAVRAVVHENMKPKDAYGLFCSLKAKG